MVADDDDSSWYPFCQYSTITTLLAVPSGVGVLLFPAGIGLIGESKCSRLWEKPRGEELVRDQGYMQGCRKEERTFSFFPPDFNLSSF